MRIVGLNRTLHINGCNTANSVSGLVTPAVHTEYDAVNREMHVKESAASPMPSSVLPRAALKNNVFTD
jgi:hypothetical protein